MNKNIYCLIATIFIGASIATMLSCEYCSPMKEYVDSLDEDQKKLYKEVVAERRNQYLMGTGLGTLLAGIYLFLTKGAVNIYANACIFVTITFIVQYLFYSLMPKKAYMVTEMKDKEQIEKWLAVYKDMKMRYHGGMLIGYVGYFIMSYGISL